MAGWQEDVLHDEMRCGRVHSESSRDPVADAKPEQSRLRRLVRNHSAADPLKCPLHGITRARDRRHIVAQEFERKDFFLSPQEPALASHAHSNPRSIVTTTGYHGRELRADCAPHRVLPYKGPRSGRKLISSVVAGCKPSPAPRGSTLGAPARGPEREPAQRHKPGDPATKRSRPAEQQPWGRRSGAIGGTGRRLRKAPTRCPGFHHSALGSIPHHIRGRGISAAALLRLLDAPM